MQDILSLDKQHIWHPFAPIKDVNETLHIVKAKGNYLHLADGREIIDAISSWWVNLHGHGNEELADVLAQQARELDHVIFAGFTHEPAVRLVQNLLQLLPANYSRAFFSDDGSTAIEVAVKLAVQYWVNKGEKRTTILALEGGYHGDTFGAMSLGGKSDFFSAFHDMLFEVQVLPFPKGDGSNTKQRLKDILEQDKPALFIYEPLVQGSAGMRMYSAEVLESLLVAAKQKNVICIADEVMTGFGRTGKMFASDHVATKPDMMCMSKGITGGILPLGLTFVNERIEQAFLTEDKSKAFYHGHSYTGNPLSSAVGVKSLEILQRPETQANIQFINQQHQQFKEKIKEHKKVSKVQVLGVILSIEVTASESTSYFNSLRDQLYQSFLAEGVLMRPLGNVIYIFPPYTFTDKELNQCYAAIEKVLDAL